MAPIPYDCGACREWGMKLWRPYQTFYRPGYLRCAVCAAAEEGKDISDMDQNGTYTSNSRPGRRTDQIGWYVPAIPDTEGTQFWGYTSTPEDRREWWRDLPSVKVPSPLRPQS